MATGRGVLEIAHESYALTLYTHWHLEQRRRLTMLAQQSERLDLAGLMAGAYHDPKSLVARHAAFIDTLRAPSAHGHSAGARDRQLAVIRAAHMTMVNVVTVLPS